MNKRFIILNLTAASLLLGGLFFINQFLINIPENILLLGYRGPGLPEAYYIDSFIVVSKFDDKIVLTSIPRDYLVENEKITEIYHNALVKGESGEEAFSKLLGAAESISGLEINYYTAINFDNFVKLIDSLGGLEVSVERSFTDTNYPNDQTLGYMRVTFDEGVELMSGNRILQYVRSRHAEGIEGSDFSRSRRQLIVLKALKNKFSSLSVNEKLKLIKNFNKSDEIIKTNIGWSKIPIFISEVNHSEVFTQTLEPATGLVCPGMTSQGDYSISPCTQNDPSKIKDFFINKNAP